MTAPDLTAVERVVVARFEAAPTPPEVLRLRVARAIADSDGCDMSAWPGMYEERADAALAVFAGEQSRAIARVLALADELDARARLHDAAEPVSTEGLLRATAAARHCRTHAAAIRAAVAGS